MFGKNKTFNVLIKKDDPEPLESIILVREGFSIWAFMFHFFWAAYKGLWLFLIICLIVLGSILACENYGVFSKLQAETVRIGFFIWAGFSANDWISSSFQRKGYVLYDIVSASNEQEAERRFFDAIFMEKRMSGYIKNALVGTASTTQPKII